MQIRPPPSIRRPNLLNTRRLHLETPNLKSPRSASILKASRNLISMYDRTLASSRHLVSYPGTKRRDKHQPQLLPLIQLEERPGFNQVFCRRNLYRRFWERPRGLLRLMIRLPRPLQEQQKGRGRTEKGAGCRQSCLRSLSDRMWNPILSK